MALQVTGYMTAQGKFYETAEEAEYEEALEILEDKIKIDLGLSANRALSIASIMSFLNTHHEIVKDYCEKYALWVSSLETNALTADEVIIDDTSTSKIAVEDKDEDISGEQRT